MRARVHTRDLESYCRRALYFPSLSAANEQNPSLGRLGGDTLCDAMMLIANRHNTARGLRGRASGVSYRTTDYRLLTAIHKSCAWYHRYYFLFTKRKWINNEWAFGVRCSVFSLSFQSFCMVGALTTGWCLRFVVCIQSRSRVCKSFGR